MRRLYLIVAAAALLVTCEPQGNNNDIIWYPVDEEEGVFVSTYGEKHRSSSQSKWRSHRRARYSGMDMALPLSYDPSENQDSSFFHNINERKPFISSLTVPKIPPSFQYHQFAFNDPNKRPQGSENFNENTFQEILNEVFDYNKNPPVSESSESKPGTGTQWGSRPQNQFQNQWSGNTMTENTFQLGNGMQKPAMENQWGTPSNTEQRPHTQWSGSSSTPFGKPTDSEWITQGNRPNNRPISSNKPNRTTTETDKLVFPEEASFPTATPDLNPTEPPTMSPCERLCPVTPEFNPVCGSNSVTYTNAGRLKCAQKCGKNVELAHYGNCGRTSLVTPLVSSIRKQKSRGFWFIDK